MLEKALSAILAIGMSVVSVAAPVPSTSPRPQLAPGVYQPILEADQVPAAVNARAAVIRELATGRTVYAKSADESLPMASLTKLMTAYVILKYHSLDDVVTIPAEVTKVQGGASQVLNIKPGDRLTVREALQGLLIYSANDVAVALAGWDAGSVTQFVDKMNAAAKDLGLTKTVFRNPTGLDEVGHVSSANDLAHLTQVVLQSAIVRETVQKRTGSFTTQAGRPYVFATTNQLLARAYVKGVKTGYTEAAGQCLISLTQKDGKEFITVILGSPDRFQESQYMINLTLNAKYY